MFDPVQTVLVDANVWYSRTLRDWIGMLYTTGDRDPFRIRWTEDILAEVVYHLRKKHPDWDGRKISIVRDRFEKSFENGRVADFTVDDSYRGRDPGDAHVHAAAVACGADYLLTLDTKDFEWDDQVVPYEVLHPDQFFLLVDDSAPELVAQVARQMCDFFLRRQQECHLPEALRKAQCPEFAARVRDHLQRLF